MENKVDVFETLNHIDDFDVEYYDKLSDDEKKSLAPYVLMLWLSGTKSETQMLQLNVFLNSLMFDFPSIHNGLLYKLACISSDGKRKKYNWVKKSVKSKKYSTTVDVIKRHYQCSSAVALDYIKLLDYTDVAAIAMDLGEQNDTLKKIQKEMK